MPVYTQTTNDAAHRAGPDAAPKQEPDAHGRINIPRRRRRSNPPRD